jgi:hypothetical protein
VKVSACGAVKEEWLSDWNIKPEDYEAAWKAKLALDEKIASQNGEIRENYGIIPDIKPYTSQIDGSVIESRTQHRNHLKQHGCIEVGNEQQKQRKPEEPKGLKDAIGREVYRHLS